LGSLEPGKLADVIIVDTESTAMVPLYDVATNLVYSASPRDVRTTIIQGRVVMEDRRLLTVDPAVVRAKVREIMQRVRVVVPDVK
jgi:cytosine/adenosine deaminase-related metal-dependent hydrolase